MPTAWFRLEDSYGFAVDDEPHEGERNHYGQQFWQLQQPGFQLGCYA